MISIVYRIILLMVVALIIWEILAQKDVKTQATAALVVIPLIMRALMIA